MKKSTNDRNVRIVAAGLDLADAWSDLIGLDEEGNVVRSERVRTTEAELVRVFSSMPPTTIALEVGTHSAWVSRVLRSVGHTVVVANARRVALIHRNKRKNNRIDAELLARLVRSDRKLLFPIEHRDERGQADLVVLRSREMLVECRTKLINHVRGVSKSMGKRLPSCSAEAFVRRCSELIPTTIRKAVVRVLEEIARLTDGIRDCEREIATMIKHHSDAEQLMQIKGVGGLTALAYVLTVEDPKRIVRSRSAGAYFGLVPGSDDSGEKHAQRRITKEGDPFCRRLLVLAGHYILGPFGEDSDLRRHGLAIAARGGKNAKKRAVIAVARKLAVVMHRLWISGETYVPLFNAGRQAAAA